MFYKMFPENTVTGYPSVLTKRMLSIGTDGEKQFNFEENKKIFEWKQIYFRIDSLLAANFYHKSKFQYIYIEKLKKPLL